MPSNLLEQVQGYFTPDVISKLSALVGESPINTRMALGAIVPSLTAAACHQASTPSGASHLMDLLSSSNVSSIMNKFGGSLGGGSATEELLRTGSSLVSGTLGNKAEGVASLIAETTGIRSSSASSLMNMAAPVFFGGLLKQVTASGLSASSLPSFLASHRDQVLQAIPSGLASRLGVSSNLDLCGTPVPMARPVVVEERRHASAWLWSLPLAAILLGFLAWKAFQSPSLTSIHLPCGTVLSVEQGSFNFKLANFLLRGAPSDLPKQFVFDHLNFDTATTQLTPGSNTTVANLTQIMKCYPNMMVQLEGFTDNTGDPDSNMKLSSARADAVRNMLMQGGIDGARITTGGYGQERPIASNDTEDGRAKNRRTELVVTKLN